MRHLKYEDEKVLSPNKDDDGVWIHQNAWFNIGEYDKPTTETYSLHKKENGVYLFVIEGKLKIDNQSLDKRDGYGAWDTDEIEFTAEKSSKVLLMELPMQIS